MPDIPEPPRSDQRESSSTINAVLSIKRRTVNILGKIIKPGTRVALLDHPDYMNVGDHMIWSGQEEYLRILAADLVYSASIATYNAGALRRSNPDLILFQGGGNFGDLWPTFQKFREGVVQAFSSIPIVQLPQTFWFNSPIEAEKSRKIFRRTGNFRLLVRDSESMARAQTAFCGTSILECPDMAFGLPLKSDPSDHSSALALIRNDAESSGSRPDSLRIAVRRGLGLSLIQLDWGEPRWAANLWKLAHIPMRLSHVGFPGSRNGLSLRAMARLEGTCSNTIIAWATRLFSRQSLIVTDRLHAHVLACMLGIPNIVIDNRYGKIRPIYDQYTSAFGLTQFADSFEDVSMALDSVSGMTD